MPLPFNISSKPSSGSLPFAGAESQGGGFISGNNGHQGSIAAAANAHTQGTASDVSISGSLSEQEELDDARYAYGARLRRQKASEEKAKEPNNGMVGMGSSLLQGNLRRNFAGFVRKNRVARHLSEDEKEKLKEIVVRRARVKRSGEDQDQFTGKDKKAMQLKAKTANHKGEISDEGLKGIKRVINQL